ncbi:hypothetical protein FAI41_08595 [Acetobacteraceae bacterium]|nr:hypothetical protein FAI41_08595 [Acetobacteraceae bacterium]
MSGKFSNRGNKGSGSKIFGIGLAGIILIGLGSLYFLQPKPPKSETVHQTVSLSLGESSPVAPSPYSENAGDSSLPTLPLVGNSQTH